MCQNGLAAYQLQALRRRHGRDRPDDQVLSEHPAHLADGRPLAGREVPLEDGEELERESRQERVDRLLQVLVPNLKNLDCKSIPP